MNLVIGLAGMFIFSSNFFLFIPFLVPLMYYQYLKGISSERTVVFDQSMRDQESEEGALLLMEESDK